VVREKDSATEVEWLIVTVEKKWVMKYYFG
jgi:hypothetical protein